MATEVSDDSACEADSSTVEEGSTPAWDVTGNEPACDDGCVGTAGAAMGGRVEGEELEDDICARQERGLEGNEGEV
jgi:hypothetical protein